jgi:hypothetical protein
VKHSAEVVRTNCGCCSGASMFGTGSSWDVGEAGGCSNCDSDGSTNGKPLAEEVACCTGVVPPTYPVRLPCAPVKPSPLAHSSRFHPTVNQAISAVASKFPLLV